MSDFDPYYQWLGIPLQEQPASHYRLLGIPEFDGNVDIIKAAAERQTIYLRTLQAGEHAILVAELLNEVSRARVTLLNAGEKAEYDEQLRKQQTPEPEPEPTPTPVIQTPAPTPVVVRGTVTQDFPVSVVHTAKKPRRTRQQEVWKRPVVIGVSVVGVIGVFILVMSLMFSGDADPVASNTPPVVSSPLMPSPRPEPTPLPEPRPTIPPQPELTPEPETQPEPTPEDLTGLDTPIPLEPNVGPASLVDPNTPPEPTPEPEPAPAPANTLPPSLQEGLVAYYPFNGNAKDESGNGHHGIPRGVEVAMDRFGNAGRAYRFDLDDSILLDDRLKNIAPTTSQGITITCWASQQTSGYLLSQYVNGSPDRCNFFASIGNSGEWSVTGNGIGQMREGAQGRTLNQWNQWVFQIHPGTDGCRIQLNAQEVKSGSVNLNRVISVTDFLIGAFSGTNRLSGSLDDIRIYNRALSAAEVKSLYDYESTPPNQPDPIPPLPPEPAPASVKPIPANLLKGLFAYYPFTGNTKDESGQGHHATRSSSIPVKDRFGKENSAQRFRGQDHIEVPHADEFNLQQQQGFTISLWINAFKGNGSNALVSKNNGGGDKDKWFLTLNDSKVLFHVNYGEGRSTNGTGDEGSYLINRTPSFNLNEWGHILISSDRQKVRFFSNGKFISQEPVFGGPPSNNKASIRIGMTEGANYYSGLMDDIRFYNRALPAAEVKALYEYESKPPPVPPTAPATESTTNTFGMKLNLIPSGSFLMGSPEDETGRQDNETQHKVTITKAFYMQTTEVTQGQWKDVMGTEPWKGKSSVKEGPNNAATYVSWDDAMAYCKKLSEAEGKTYRLPTEAEWEYACRAGKETAWSFGDDEKDLGDYAWYRENAYDIQHHHHAHQVGLKKPNAFGLYDMHGNVWEWCHDYFGEDYYKQAPEKDPPGPKDGPKRIVRGASWTVSVNQTRSASRHSAEQNVPSQSAVGFRLVREWD